MWTPGSLPRHWLGRSSAALVAALASLSVMLGGVTAAAAQEADGDDGLDIVSETIYRPDVDRSVVAVRASFTITNEQPPVSVGGSTTEYFFDQFVVWLPDDATEVRATVDGRDASYVEDEGGERGTRVALVTLPSSLYFGERAVVDVEYLLAGGDPREDAVTRINPSYLAFPAWACCDDGQSSVRIEVPGSFTVDLEGVVDDVDQRDEGALQVFEARDITDAERFFLYVFGRNDDGLRQSEVRVGDRDVTVSAWPDDEA
ncbi:MAG: hypothetical protein ACR2N9_09000, partial [Acidimicrobiia bacterium]